MELITVAAVNIDPWGWQPFLYIAPRYTLEEGDIVIVEDPKERDKDGKPYDEIQGTVVGLDDIFVGSEHYEFMLKAMNEGKPLKKVLAMIRRTDFTYPTIEEPEESEPEESE